MLLHPIAGTLVFVLVMLGLFQSIFTLAAPAVAWIDVAFGSLADRVHGWLPNAAGDLLADGVIAGVGGVLVFLPQIVLLLTFLALLEKVGYLARAAFLADRVMGRFGLEGRSFVALLSSFACAIPGIMAARTIPNDRRRLATMMAAPLMTCTARLPVYTLLVSAFVPDRALLGPLRAQGLTMFGLYALGAVSGLVYAGVLSLATRGAGGSPVLLEMPPYRWPTLAIDRAPRVGRRLVVRAQGGHDHPARHDRAVGAAALPGERRTAGRDRGPGGQLRDGAQRRRPSRTRLEPVFGVLGFDWRTNVAIIGSLAAREVFVSTLAVTTAAESEDSLPHRLAELRDADGDPVYDGPTVAALLVFFVYALQCMSTVAVLRRETNSWRWPLIGVGSMLALAYVAALIARTVVTVVS